MFPLSVGKRTQISPRVLEVIGNYSLENVAWSENITCFLWRIKSELFT